MDLDDGRDTGKKESIIRVNKYKNLIENGGVYVLCSSTYWDIMVIAHSIGVISLRITSSVRSSGQ